jgi:hypothetical protein
MFSGLQSSYVGGFRLEARGKVALQAPVGKKPPRLARSSLAWTLVISTQQGVISLNIHGLQLMMRQMS